MHRRSLLLALAALPGAARAGVAFKWGSVVQPQLMLVIDDVGYSREQGEAVLRLPGPFDCSVLPESPHGRELALEAHARGKEVMLHAPMANSQHLKLGPGALTPDLDKARLQKVLRADLDAVPFAVGVNNHMGSLLTARRAPMEWVMEVLRERRLWFVDSRTSAKTVAWQVARERGVPALMRDVFLDDVQTPQAIDIQFKRALAIARQYGSALMIGHPHPVTTDYLARALPTLDEQGFQRLTVSAFLAEQTDLIRLNRADPRLWSNHRRHWGYTGRLG